MISSYGTSAITIIAAADKTSLTTVDRVRQYTDLCDLEDDRLLRLIDVATGAISRFLGRTLHRERVLEEIFDSTFRIFLPERSPIVTVHSMSIGDYVIEPDRYRIDDSRRIHLPQVGFLNAESFYDYDNPSTYYGGGFVPWLTGGSAVRNGWKIEYSGGYLMPGSTQGAAGDPKLPDDIEAACVESIRSLQRFTAGKFRAGVSSERLGDYSVSYLSAAEQSAILPLHVQELLLPHRKIVI